MASSVSSSLHGCSSSSSCSVRISTVVAKIDSVVTNQENASIIHSFHKYMKEKDSSENHQVNNLKV
ncbi:MAG: hypothetical protein QOC23_07380, partial [Nitrososphaeraceae archaeon]|nr:hypothetical protein [Nitrososphaeraceae archaeon]